MTRQRMLACEDPPMLWVVLDEGVLRRQVGGRHVMGEQINRLIQEAGRPNIVIEVVPTSAGAYLGLQGPFVIADFVDAPSVGVVLRAGFSLLFPLVPEEQERG